MCPSIHQYNVFLQVRYAPNLFPQCALYSRTNDIPAPPFIMNITTSSSGSSGSGSATFKLRGTSTMSSSLPSSSSSAAFLPLAVRAPALAPYLARYDAVKGWKTWKGRTIPAPGRGSSQVVDEQEGSRFNSGSSSGILAATPPMGFNSWNGYHCNVSCQFVDRIPLQHKLRRAARIGGCFSGADEEYWSPLGVVYAHVRTQARHQSCQ